MTCVVAIEQPNYIPWLGYFDLIRQSDVWVWYDDVQYTKRDWRNRNRIAAPEGATWLTIPVKTRGRFQQAIREVEIDYSQPWVRRHLETLRRCYAASPFFNCVLPVLTRALAAQHVYLADLTITLNESLCSLLGIAPRYVRSSSVPRASPDRQGRLLEICRAVGGTSYLSGPAARAYIEPRGFAETGIELRYIVYDYPPYARGSRGFVPNLSVLDALVWLGPEGTATFLAAHGRSTQEGLC